MAVAGDSIGAARILLVDCEAQRASSLAGYFRNTLTGASVVHLRSGRDAMDRLRTAATDLLLLDLPSISDLSPDPEQAVARLVRLSPGALVIAMSDGGSVSAAMAALRGGAHDHVARPLADLAFAARLREIAGRHGKSHPLPAEPPASERPWRGDIHRVVDMHRAGEAAADMAAGADLGAPTQPSPTTPGHRPTVLPMWQQEQRIIEQAIESFGGNIALAAQALEVSPSTIYRKRQAWAALESRRGAA